LRLPNSEHESHRWRIGEIAPDFRLEDAWALPAEGGADDFATLLEVMDSLDPATGAPAVVRLLFMARRRVGRMFGWDDGHERLPVPGRTETTLSERLPPDLRGSVAESRLRGSASFTPLYRTDDEWVAELSNRTVHALMQLGWVDLGERRYRGQMGVYVKPRGRLGELYMTAIGPFRHRIVYPALMAQIERAWNERLARR
jgi:hypothetical protein